MKKRYRAALMLLMMSMFLCLMTEPAFAIAKAVILEPDEVTMYVGGKQQLTMYVGGSPVSADGWSSGNKNVATVSKKGVVTAKKAGKVKITCKTGFGYNLTCNITVKKTLELSGYLDKSYKKLVAKAPEAVYLNASSDPAGIGNVYVFETSKGTEPFFRYDQKTNKIQSIQISQKMGDMRQSRYTLYGVSLGMPWKNARSSLKANGWKANGKQATNYGATLLYFKKGGQKITLYIENGKVEAYQWSR